jgi:hypothetical protein
VVHDERDSKSPPLLRKRRWLSRAADLLSLSLVNGLSLASAADKQGMRLLETGESGPVSITQLEVHDAVFARRDCMREE